MQLQNMLKSKIGWSAAAGGYSDMILSSRIRLARNLAGRPFPPQAETKSQRSVLMEVWESARNAKGLAKAAFFRLGDLEPVDRQFLMERHLISLEHTSQSGERGVVVGDREMTSLMVNEEDHLRLQGLDSGLSLQAAWERLNMLDDELSSQLSYAYLPNWGFLTSCPTNAGTGMRASCLIHLPALTMTNQINRVLENLTRLGIVARGFYGEGTKVLGDLFQISNATTMGHAETEILENLEKIVKKIIEHEQQSRQALLARQLRLKTLDTVHRSWGNLTNARAISYEETMHNLSLIRLSLTMGENFPITYAAINELILFTQPAHIQMTADKKMEPEERDEFRAAFIRKKLGDN